VKSQEDRPGSRSWAGRSLARATQSFASSTALPTSIENMRQYLQFFSALTMVCLSQCPTLCFGASAAETLAALSDSKVDQAYEDCDFTLDTGDGPGLLALGNKLPPSKGPNKCEANLGVPLMDSLKTPNGPAGYIQGSMYIDVVRYESLPGRIEDQCKKGPGHDDCVENWVFGYYGFRKNNQGRWSIISLLPKFGTPIDKEQALSSVFEGTIQNADGVTVFSEWESPYTPPGGVKPNILWLTLVRRAEFGYVTIGNGTVVPIPLGSTAESRAKAKALADQIIRTFQQVKISE
jgi:hypothetical protein